MIFCFPQTVKLAVPFGAKRKAGGDYFLKIINFFGKIAEMLTIIPVECIITPVLMY